MAFHYRSAPLTEHAFHVVLLGLAFALGATPAVRDAWATAVESTPAWVLVCVAPWVGHQLAFWGSAALFGYVERHEKPTFLARHRIQSGPPQRPPTPKVLRNLAMNQGVWSPLLLVAMYGALVGRGWAPSPTLPAAARLLAEVLAMSACSLVWFYASHRFLHRKWWMKRIHRVHHEFRTTSVLAAEYAHPVEFVFGNFGTLACGIVLVAPSLPALYVFAAMAFSVFLVHHSGYALPWVSWSMHHDWHHYRFQEAFGSIGVLDKLFGTAKEYGELRDGDVR